MTHSLDDIKTDDWSGPNLIRGALQKMGEFSGYEQKLEKLGAQKRNPCTVANLPMKNNTQKGPGSMSPDSKRMYISVPGHKVMNLTYNPNEFGSGFFPSLQNSG